MEQLQISDCGLQIWVEDGTIADWRLRIVDWVEDGTIADCRLRIVDLDEEE